VTNREADVLDKARAIAYLPVEYPQTTLGDRLRELRVRAGAMGHGAFTDETPELDRSVSREGLPLQRRDRAMRRAIAAAARHLCQLSLLLANVLEKTAFNSLYGNQGVLMALRSLVLLSLSLLALAGCAPSMGPVSFPSCPPGTKVSGEVGGGGGFGGAVTFSARFDCAGGPVVPSPAPTAVTPLSVH
jgi:hypothetical protein